MTSPAAAPNLPSETQSLVTAIRELHQAEIRTLVPHENGETPVAILPQGKRVESLLPILDAAAPQPRRRRGCVLVRTAESLIAFTKRHRAAATSVIFANPSRDKPSIVTVFDWHPDNGEVLDAMHAEFRASYPCEVSEEWKAWTAIDGKGMNQRDFAHFIEDRIVDVIAAPTEDASLEATRATLQGNWATPTELVGLSRSLQVKADIVVREAVTLASGEIDLTYTEVHRDNAGGKLHVPNLFVLAIPVFFMGPAYRVPVRLRYRLHQGQVTWSMHLYRADRCFDHAFDEIAQRVQQETELPLFVGRTQRGED